MGLVSCPEGGFSVLPRLSLVTVVFAVLPLATVWQGASSHRWLLFPWPLTVPPFSSTQCQLCVCRCQWPAVAAANGETASSCRHFSQTLEQGWDLSRHTGQGEGAGSRSWPSHRDTGFTPCRADGWMQQVQRPPASAAPDQQVETLTVLQDVAALLGR